MSPVDQPHAKYAHGYAVVRVSKPVDESYPENSVAVVKVFSSKIAAQNEAQRLNGVNAGKSCKYFVATTHIITDPG